MLQVESDGVIHLTRGDSAWFAVSIDNTISGEEYTLGDRDVLTLTIKRRAKDKEALVKKNITGTNIFHIEPEDTQGFRFGNHVYDVQLTTADDDVFTVIPPTTFEVLSEVTY